MATEAILYTLVRGEYILVPNHDLPNLSTYWAQNMGLTEFNCILFSPYGIMVKDWTVFSGNLVRCFVILFPKVVMINKMFPLLQNQAPQLDVHFREHISSVITITREGSAKLPCLTFNPVPVLLNIPSISSPVLLYNMRIKEVRVFSA